MLWLLQDLLVWQFWSCVYLCVMAADVCQRGRWIGFRISLDNLHVSLVCMVCSPTVFRVIVLIYLSPEKKNIHLLDGEKLHLCSRNNRQAKLCLGEANGFCNVVDFQILGHCLGICGYFLISDSNRFTFCEYSAYANNMERNSGCFSDMSFTCCSRVPVIVLPVSELTKWASEAEVGQLGPLSLFR